MLIRISILIILFSFLQIFGQIPLQIKQEPLKLIGGDGNFYMNPRWSPEGSKIAFSSANYQGLWIYHLEDKNLVKISNEEACGFGYSWSADGHHILTRVARYEDGRRFNALKIFNPGAGTANLLTDYRSRLPGLPTWSADNSEVYFYSDNQLEVVQTGKRTKIADGKPRFYAADGSIYISNPQTNQLKTLNPIKNADYINLVLSPDGQYLAFEVMGGHLYTLSVDGLNLHDLGVGYRAQWSPDSQYLVYMICQDDGHQYTASDISISTVDGSATLLVTNSNDRLEMNPSWSPDGTKIIYDEFNTGVIYIQELE